jgi:hypothetical protein
MNQLDVSQTELSRSIQAAFDERCDAEEKAGEAEHEASRHRTRMLNANAELQRLVGDGTALVWVKSPSGKTERVAAALTMANEKATVTIMV